MKKIIPPKRRKTNPELMQFFCACCTNDSNHKYSLNNFIDEKQEEKQGAELTEVNPLESSKIDKGAENVNKYSKNGKPAIEASFEPLLVIQREQKRQENLRKERDLLEKYRVGNSND